MTSRREGTLGIPGATPNAIVWGRGPKEPFEPLYKAVVLALNVLGISDAEFRTLHAVLVVWDTRRQVIRRPRALPPRLLAAHFPGIDPESITKRLRALTRPRGDRPALLEIVEPGRGNRATRYSLAPYLDVVARIPSFHELRQRLDEDGSDVVRKWLVARLDADSASRCGLDEPGSASKDTARAPDAAAARTVLPCLGTAPESASSLDEPEADSLAGRSRFAGGSKPTLSRVDADSGSASGAPRDLRPTRPETGARPRPRFVGAPADARPEGASPEQRAQREAAVHARNLELVAAMVADAEASEAVRMADRPPPRAAEGDGPEPAETP